MKNIAIIPARSGSKGVKDKNIRDLCGKPLLAYTIEAALRSEQFDEVMVSTDSEKYSEIAKEFGASVPFLRSEESASDAASSWDMVDEVLKNYREFSKEYDSFCLLQPTSPLRFAIDIKEAYKIYNDKAMFAVVSVCEAEHSPLWCGHLPESKEFVGFINPDNIKRRQDERKFYRLNGAIYIVNIEKFNNNRFFYQEGSYAYIMPQDRSVDIDTEMDFLFAELIMKSINKYPNRSKNYGNIR